MSNLSNLLLDGLKIRPVTKHLVELLYEDRPLSPACIVDFGVDSSDHYYALRNMVGGGLGIAAIDGDRAAIKELRKRIMQLDDACGNGFRLNALVRRYVPEFAQVVHFYTSWDAIYGRADEQSPAKR